jgi:RsiW-degrading membrane proteinase PrsW (M82 family)
MSIQQDPAGGTPLDQKRPGGEMRSAASSAPTRSQLLPFGSEWQELVHKPYFLPGLFGAAVLALMWASIGDSSNVVTVHLGKLPIGVPTYTFVLAFCLSVGGAFALYRMAGKPKVWWLMPAVAAFAAVLCSSPVMGLLQGVFDLGVSPFGGTDSVVLKFVKMLFLAGLPEECLKAIPVAIGLVIGKQLLAGRKTEGPLRQLAVLDPLDGILIGAAAGFGFAFAETMFLYVPRTIAINDATVMAMAVKVTLFGIPLDIPRNLTTFGQISWLYDALGSKIGFDRAAVEFQRVLVSRQSSGLELMIPRLFSNVFGHAAYAGIFGYFIGLAALKPQNLVKTLLTGLLIAASIHAAWNALAQSALMGFVVASAAFGALAVCIIKARKLAPDRSQLLASQILDRFAGPMTAPKPAPVPAPVAAPAPAAFAPAAPMVVPAAGAMVAREAPKSITWDDDSGLRTLEIGSVRVPATIGAKIYEGHVPGAHAGRGDGVIAEVTANPGDPAVLGLKNLSDRAWTFTGAGRAERELAPGRSIRLEAGMQIRIGQSIAHVR